MLFEGIKRLRRIDSFTRHPPTGLTYSPPLDTALSGSADKALLPRFHPHLVGIFDRPLDRRVLANNLAKYAHLKSDHPNDQGRLANRV